MRQAVSGVRRIYHPRTWVHREAEATKGAPPLALLLSAAPLYVPPVPAAAVLPRPAGFLDEGFEVLDLALDRIRERVGAVAPSAAIVIEDCEALLQGRGQGRARSPVVERADHQDDRRSYPDRSNAMAVPSFDRTSPMDISPPSVGSSLFDPSIRKRSRDQTSKSAIRLLGRRVLWRDPFLVRRYAPDLARSLRSSGIRPVDHSGLE